jgi:hypothetical protein
MTTKLTRLHALIGAALVAGCSSTSSDDGGQTPGPAPGPDATIGLGTPDSASAGCRNPMSLITGDGSCNNVPVPATRVPFAVGAGGAPTFTGGALVDGLYAAIKAEGWNTTAGSGRQMGLVIANAGKTMLWFGQTLNADGSGDGDAGTPGLAWLRGNYTLSPASSNSLGLTADCHAGTTAAPDTLLYTATATDPPQLILANAGAKDPTAAVTTYERQGCP